MAKQVTNRERLQELLDKIKEIKRIKQGRISILAGYETENYLAEVKSTGEISDNVIKAVSALYEKAKINPGILNDEKPQPLVTIPQQDYRDEYIAALKKINELEKKISEQDLIIKELLIKTGQLNSG